MKIELESREINKKIIKNFRAYKTQQKHTMQIRLSKENYKLE